MSEPLRLEAEVVDKFSRPLRSLRDTLQAINAPKNARQIQREFDELTRAVQRTSNAIKDGLGLASFSAAAGIAAVSNSLRSFSLGVGELRALSRETGLSVQSMRVLEAAAVRFQIAPEKVRGGLKTFAENLYDFRRQFGTTYAEVLKYQPDLAKALRDSSPDKALDVALDFLARVPDRQTAARFSRLLFGQTDFARFGQEGSAELRKILADTLSRIGALTPEDAKKAEAFEQASAKVRASLEGLQKSVAIAAAPVLSDFARWLDHVIQAGQGTIGESVERNIRMIGDAARSINQAVEGSIGWEWLIKGLIAAKVAQTALSFVKLGGGFLELGRAVGGADLGKLSAVFKIMAGFGALWATYKVGAARGETQSATSGPAGTGSHAGAAPSPPGSGRKVEERTGRALREGVAEGVEAGLSSAVRAAALADAGSGGMGGGGGGGVAFLRDAVVRGRGKSWRPGADLGDAARRGRMPAPQSFRGGATGKWWTPERQRYAVDYLMKHAGLSEYGAAGLVARWAGVEAGAGPGARNPFSGAEGVAQWLGARKRRGITDRPDIDGQLAHAAWELNNTERRAGDALRKAANPWEGARGASMYERAEGYNARSGLDNFTTRTPVDSVYRQFKGDQAKDAAPKVGTATESARAAGAVGGGQSQMPLFVRIHGAPRSVRVMSDPGSAFSGVEVERKRAASE